ncbi:hypothetical protein [Scytonema hofmannii]|nr:hypothetical protein [Scytonema hofmannii]
MNSLQRIKLCSHTGSDRILRLDIPTGISDREIEVTVTIQPVTPTKRGWMPGFFEEVIGGWVGNP